MTQYFFCEKYLTFSAITQTELINWDGEAQVLVELVLVRIIFVSSVRNPRSSSTCSVYNLFTNAYLVGLCLFIDNITDEGPDPLKVANLYDIVEQDTFLRIEQSYPKKNR